MEGFRRTCSARCSRVPSRSPSVRERGCRRRVWPRRSRPRARARPPPRKVEPGSPRHVGAPMPGVVATVKAVVGARVARGDLLLALEAMKMETAVRAESDGEVAEVLARPGQAVDAKDLLIVLR